MGICYIEFVSHLEKPYRQGPFYPHFSQIGRKLETTRISEYPLINFFGKKQKLPAFGFLHIPALQNLIVALLAFAWNRK